MEVKKQYTDAEKYAYYQRIKKNPNALWWQKRNANKFFNKLKKTNFCINDNDVILASIELKEKKVDPLVDTLLTVKRIRAENDAYINKHGFDSFKKDKLDANGIKVWENGKPPKRDETHLAYIRGNWVGVTSKEAKQLLKINPKADIRLNRNNYTIRSY